MNQEPEDDDLEAEYDFSGAARGKYCEQFQQGTYVVPLEAQEQGRKYFLELADRLTRSRDPEEQSRLKEELARMTFGE